MSGSKIIEGLKVAVAGDLVAVTIDGQRWVRQDAHPTTDVQVAMRRVNEIILIGEVLDEAKYDALVAALAAKDARIAELERVLARVEPNIGWRSTRGENPNLYYCEFCAECATDAKDIPHHDECVVFAVRAVLRGDTAPPLPAPVGDATIRLTIPPMPQGVPCVWQHRDPATLYWLPVIQDWYVESPSGREHIIAQRDHAELQPVLPAPVGDVGELVAEAERLVRNRRGPDFRSGTPFFGPGDEEIAIELLPKLAARLRAMDAALEEFAPYADAADRHFGSKAAPGSLMTVTVGMLRRARAARGGKG